MKPDLVDLECRTFGEDKSRELGDLIGRDNVDLPHRFRLSRRVLLVVFLPGKPYVS